MPVVCGKMAPEGPAGDEEEPALGQSDIVFSRCFGQGSVRLCEGPGDGAVAYAVPGR